jgi:hypothetical protein
MARRSLKPQLNQIRAWVRQGRTDAWIAHQLEVSGSELREFRSQHDLTADEEDTGTNEIDLRDEIEAEIEAAAAEEPEEDEDEEAEDLEDEESADEDEGDGDEVDGDGDDAPRERARRERRPRQRSSGGGRERQNRERDGGGGGDGDGQPRRRRRRGRRGGRGRRRPEYQATFDHGERDGYGLWLDPTVKDNPVYSQHWAGKREVTVRIDPDQIVIRRPGAPDSEGGSRTSGG